MSDEAALETNVWYKTLRVLLYALLLTPLWVWSIFLFPFITTKVLYLRILVEVAFVIYLLLALRYPQLRPRWNWLTIAVWVYMGVILLASIFGVNFDKSLLGTIERGEGVITMLHLALYFTMLAAVFRTEKDWYRYLMVLVGLIGFIGLYGLGQLLQIGFLLPASGTRITGTIGNAAFFAAFMLFGIFLSSYLLQHQQTREGKRAAKVFLWLVLLISLLAIYLSQTRGALLALAVAVLLYALFLVFKARQGKVRLAAGGLIALLILGGLGLYAARDSALVKSQNTLRRLATISLTDITTQSRFDTWNASLQAWQDRPILGYGYENYNVGFNKYFPARIFKDQGSQVWFDRAHNIVFDQLVTAGIVGFIAYLSIFFFALRYLFRTYKIRTDGRGGPVILALLLVAYFLQNIFVFDTQATYLVFFILLAYISFMERAYLATAEPAMEGKRAFQPGFLVAAGLAIVMAVILYFINLEPAFANYHTVRGIFAARTGQFRQVKPAFEKALSYGTYMDEEIRQRLVDFANEAIGSGQLSPQEQLELYRFTIAELQKSLDESEQDVKNYLYLVTVYNRAENFNPVYADEALQVGEQALTLSPTRPQVYFELGQAYFNKDEEETGLAQFQKAIELNPEPKESHFNFAVAAILAGREDLAEAKLNEILNQRRITLTGSEYHTLGRAYLQKDNLAKAVENFRKAIALEPDNVNFYATLARAYGDRCDLASAQVVLDELVARNNSLALEARQFMAELQQECQ